ncbi:MAG: hypothetical protein MRY83_19805 [Flavobacteriales bacterium]|nr:hypothetical protein [Flavobacteriales bacterium]
MKNSNLYSLLSSFNKETCKKFQDFLKSPYLNTNNKATQLFELYLKTPEKKLEKPFLHNKLYPNEDFKDDKLRLVISRLYNLALEFLRLEGFRRTKTSQHLLLHELNLLNQYKIFDQQYRKANNTSLLETLQLEEANFYLATKINPRQSTNNLQELSNSIDDYFLFQKLKYSCELYNRKQILDKEYDFSFLENILQYLHNHPPKYPPTYLYYQLLKLIRANEEPQFFLIKKLLQTQSKEVHKKELKNMYVFLMNFCVKQINANNTKYYVELFDIYKSLIKNEIIIEEETIGLGDFKNIATVGLRLKELDWVQEFTEQYTSYLNEQHQESAKSYNLARICFVRSNYKDALKLLRNVDYSDVYFELGSRVLLLKVYYEQEDIDLFPAQMQSLRTYLSRSNEVSDYQKSLYLNFLRLIKKLFRFKGGNKRGLKEFKEELKQTSNVVDLEWIKEKAMEFNF